MNTEQQKYISSLDYDYKASGLDMQLTDSFKAKLADVETPAQLLELIKEAKCFGKKDSLIVELLG